MNQQTQNQDNKPTDYGFIFNQPDTKSSDVRMRKKLIIIAIAAGALVIILILSLVFSAKDNVKKETVTSPGGITSEASKIAAAEDVTRSFFSLAYAENFEKAYDLFDAKQASISKKEFLTGAVPIL